MDSERIGIGIRAFTDGFAYVCLAGTQDHPKVIDRDRLTFPKGQTIAEALCWVRKQIQELLQRHSIRTACIKAIEPVSKKKSTERLYVEAVIMEALYSLVGVTCIPRIKSQLRRDIAHFKDPPRYLERVLANSSYLEELNTPRFQEATIAAVAALPSK